MAQLSLSNKTRSSINVHTSTNTYNDDLTRLYGLILTNKPRRFGGAKTTTHLEHLVGSEDFGRSETGGARGRQGLPRGRPRSDGMVGHGAPVGRG